MRNKKRGRSRHPRGSRSGISHHRAPLKLSITEAFIPVCLITDVRRQPWDPSRWSSSVSPANHMSKQALHSLNRSWQDITCYWPCKLWLWVSLLQPWQNYDLCNYFVLLLFLYLRTVHGFALKRYFTQKNEFLSSFTPPQVVLNLQDFLCEDKKI